MPDRSAYDILSLLGGQQQKNVELFSGLIDSGFKNATVGVKNASDILTQTVGSAIDYKKTVVDEWFKGEQLKQEDRQINATIDYHNAYLKNQEREIIAKENEAKVKSIDAAEKARKAEENKAAAGILAVQAGAIDDERMRILAKIGIDKAELASIAKQLDGNTTLGALPKKPSELRKLHEQFDVTNKSILENSTQLDILGVKSERAKNVMTQLQAGIITKEAAASLLGVIPDKNKDETLNKDAEVLLPPSAKGFTGDGVEARRNKLTTIGSVSSDIPTASENLDRYDIKSSFDYTSGLVGKYGPEKAQPFVNKFIQDYADEETKQKFSDKRREMEKEYFENLYKPIVMGSEEVAKKFAIDPEKFNREYITYGGNPETLEDLKKKAGYKYNEFANADPVKVNSLIADYTAKIFPETKKETNIDSNGAIRPPKFLREDGSLNGGIPQEFVEDPHGQALSKDVNTKSAKEQDIVAEVAGGFNSSGNIVHGYAVTKDDKGKSILSSRAIELLEGAKLDDLVKFGLADPTVIGTNMEGAPSYYDKTTYTQEDRRKLNKERERVINELKLSKNKAKAIRFLVDQKLEEFNKKES